jgi:hypothetical protein
MLSQLQTRDRNEWLSRLESKARKEKEITLTLRAGGATFGDVCRAMPKDIACTMQDDGSVSLKLIEPEPEPAVEAEAATA